MRKKSPIVGFDQPRTQNKLLKDRFYRLPDGRYFLHKGIYRSGERWGKVVTGTRTDGSVILGNGCVREEVLRRCPLVPYGEGPFLTPREELEKARNLVSQGSPFIVMAYDISGKHYYTGGLFFEGDPDPYPVEAAASVTSYPNPLGIMSPNLKEVQMACYRFSFERIPRMNEKLYEHVRQTVLEAQRSREST